MTEPTFSAVLAARARARPDEPLVTDARGVLTAAGLDASATRLARVLVGCGVRRDDTVAVSLPNGIDFVIACFAVWRAGATPQPLDPRLAVAERRAIEAVSAPVAAMGEAPVSPGIAWMPGVRVADDGRDLPDAAAASWKAVATSGSTGRPKVVRAAAAARLDPSRPVAVFLPREATQLVAGPLWHSAVFTYAFRGLLTGHRLVVMDRFDAVRWVDLVETHRVTWGLLVPTMMRRLLAVPDDARRSPRVHSVERVLHMGAPCPPDLKRAFIGWLGPHRVDEVYAGSESNGLTHITGTEWLEHPGSVGRPVGGTRIRVRDEAGRDLPAGSAGLVWMHRGERAAYSYVGAASHRDEDGWDTLGDVGHLDHDGYLYVHDRADDVINRGGEKIVPAFVERVLEAHPAVDEAVAFGVADDDLGQAVHAVVHGAATIDPDELIAYARARLGRRALDRVHVSAEPVRNEAGKVRRRSLAARFAVD